MHKQHKPSLFNNKARLHQQRSKNQKEGKKTDMKSPVLETFYNLLLKLIF